MKDLQYYIDKLNKLNFKDMYNGDFFLTWEKTDDELEAVFTLADALRYMRENNISTKVFESGLGISLFRDNSTRTRFSFASACVNILLGSIPDPISGRPRRGPPQIQNAIVPYGPGAVNGGVDFPLARRGKR